MRESPPSGAAVVTGGSGGIGVAVVRAFSTARYPVAVLDRNPLPAELTECELRVHAFSCDVTDPAEVAGALGQVAATHGIRHLVGLAGGALNAEVAAEDQDRLPSIEAFRGSLADNLTSQYVVLRAALGALEELDGDRSITLVSSVNALGGFGLPAYSAAKAGLIGLMHALTGPLGRRKIRINVVAPGTIPTPKTSELWHGDARHYDDLLRYSALGRLGTPEDVAAAILALATSLRHVTGHVLVVDGGQTSHRPL